jgi:acetyl-CoA carboxylase biotin carboxyl carrier protein
MVGTFYRSAGPDKEPFVKVGDRVQKGQTICIIEAMKLFNEIEAEISGTVVDILIENAKPVEFDQPLFVVAED